MQPVDVHLNRRSWFPADFRPSLSFVAFCALAVVALILAGCGGQDEQTARLPTRTPIPTFTPTPFVVNPAGTAVVPAGQPAGDLPAAVPAAQEAPAPPEAATPEPPTPAPQVAIAVVTSPQVNFRTGPSTDYALAGQANRGVELTIVGRNDAGDWFQVCCVDGQTVWIAGWLIETQGPVETVAVAADVPPPPPTATPAPVPPTATPAPAQPTNTPAPVYLFAKYADLPPRLSSNQVVSFFGALFTTNLDGAVGGYVLVIDGPAGRVEAPFTDVFQNGDPGLESEFIYNAKAEIMRVVPGVYNAYVADGGGNQVAEAYQYTVEGNTRTFLPRWKQN